MDKELTEISTALIAAIGAIVTAVIAAIGGYWAAKASSATKAPPQSINREQASGIATSTGFVANFFSIKPDASLTLDQCVQRVQTIFENNSIRIHDIHRQMDYATIVVSYANGSLGYVICWPRRLVILFGAVGSGDITSIYNEMYRVVRVALHDVLDVSA